MKSKNILLFALLVAILPSIYAVAGSPTTGVGMCITFDSWLPGVDENCYAPTPDLVISQKNGFWSTEAQACIQTMPDGNGGYAMKDGLYSQQVLSAFHMYEPNIYDIDMSLVKTIAWRWFINTSAPPSDCAEGIRAFNFFGYAGGITSRFNASNDLQVSIKSNYSIQAKYVEGYTEYWKASSSPVSGGWHTIVLKMGTSGAQLYIDGVKSAVATGINVSKKPTGFPSETGIQWETIGAGFSPENSAPNGNYQLEAGNTIACQYPIDNFIIDETWDAQRVSEFVEGNTFTCTPSALTGDVTNPTIVMQNYSQPAGVSNFTFIVTDNAELGNATINCIQHNETFQLVGFNTTLGANFDATITQTCAVDVFDSSGNTASNSFTITIEEATTSPPTLIGTPIPFVSAISNFSADVLIALLIFGILVYPFWKMASKK